MYIIQCKTDNQWEPCRISYTSDRVWSITIGAVEYNRFKTRFKAFLFIANLPLDGERKRPPMRIRKG